MEWTIPRKKPITASLLCQVFITKIQVIKNLKIGRGVPQVIIILFLLCFKNSILELPKIWQSYVSLLTDLKLNFLNKKFNNLIPPKVAKTKDAEICFKLGNVPGSLDGFVFPSFCLFVILKLPVQVGRRGPAEPYLNFMKVLRFRHFGIKNNGIFTSNVDL